MKTRYTILTAASFVALAVFSCGSKTTQTGTAAAEEQPARVVNVPYFDGDSAYDYVKAQVDFGPRTMNSTAHDACGDWLVGKLEQFGAKVYDQHADLTTYEGKIVKARNIVGSYKPEAKKRIALFSHWDSRPWADNDPDSSKHYTPILGANDGASGVGVLLEIARHLQTAQPELGIDIILLDAEDLGNHKDYDGEHTDESWCLGSQYWARVPHVDGYNARFGILLDMVGGIGARFQYEYYSEQYAKDINRKVWGAAKSLGYDNYFIPQTGVGATDDHKFINEIAHIPTIDIIPTSPQYTFFEHWHTVKDDMDAINVGTLKVVGQTVMQVIYNEH